ncbi:MAG TPA: cbb3-type cytochrome c oxidase subunit I, partial [Acidimicrobiales bacterium]|nr:cbb3-type cytochrome c oxidase subunit I [Acidimicrobiales bacterium]
LFSVGFLVVFLLGGVTGVLLASPPVDFATHDTYFVVAHFHEVLFGSAVFGGFCGIYYWYPKITGRMMRESLGKISFWLMFIGFWVTFMPQYYLGLHGMPRRIAEYSASTGWTTWNRISTAGAYLLFLSVFTMLINFLVSWLHPIPAGDNPWDAGTLEWGTTSPPPHHNYDHLPPIRSERPVWDVNHPGHTTVPGHGLPVPEPALAASSSHMSPAPPLDTPSRAAPTQPGASPFGPSQMTGIPPEEGLR